MPDIIPASKSNDRQGKFKGLFPFRRVRGAKAIVDFFPGTRFTIFRLVATQAEQQAAFMRVVHMPVQDEGINAVNPFDLFIASPRARAFEPFLSVPGFLPRTSRSHLQTERRLDLRWLRRLRRCWFGFRRDCV